ncbi:hypothetical protein A6A05_19590 [Magnetospirillum moscoviense]|uniref:Uncharacterized protein n=1 Tax=Magnetospirillum moscoviense TaxID=1437059 RepID=A0A178MYD3_9PROT|nr:hypothetical protein A6A05_19590 [Magnetospirillum moscoviense]
MFKHDEIEIYRMEDVPLERDLFLMDEKWMAAYELALLKGLAGGDWDNPGFISYATARQVTSEGLELSWYPNIRDRFHEMRVHLPRSCFVTCVGRNLSMNPRHCV